MPSVWIEWASSEHGLPKRYDFAKEVEVNAFLYGIEQASENWECYDYTQYDRDPVEGKSNEDLVNDLITEAVSNEARDQEDDKQLCIARDLVLARMLPRVT